MILRDSRRVVTDQGPSRARLAGYGGSLATYTAPPHDHNANRTADPNGARTRRNWLKGEADGLRVEGRRPKCGAILAYIGEPCARLAGHAPGHRSAEALAHDADRRRATRPSRAKVPA